MTKKEIKSKLSQLDQRIGSRLKLYRNMSKYTQREMADKLACTFQQYQKYENSINRISVSRLVEVSHILKRPLTAFTEESHKIMETQFHLAENSHKKMLLALLQLPSKKQTFALHMLEKLKSL